MPGNANARATRSYQEATAATATTTRHTNVPRVQARHIAWAAGGLAALGILAGFLWLTLACSPFVIDDAFISFRYAENLAGGYGPVFNPGERVEGYTNFLWVLIIAGANALGGDSLLSAKVLGTLANLVTLILVGWAALRWQARFVFPGLALLPPLLLAANYGFVLWGVGGLETPLFTCLVTAGLLCLARTSGQWSASGARASGQWSQADSDHRPPATGQAPVVWAGVAFALAVLARPDAVVLYVGAMVGWGLWALLYGRPGRAVVGRWLIGAAIFAGVLWAHTLFRYVYYGAWVPNTVYTKASTDVVVDPHWRALLDWLRSWGVLDPNWLAPLGSLAPGLPDWWKSAAGFVTAPGILLAAVGLWGGRRLVWGWVLGAACGAWLVYLPLIYGDWMPGWRYYQPILPVSALLITVGLNSLLALVRRHRSAPGGAELRRVALGAGEAAVLLVAGGLVALSLGEFKNRLPEIQGHVFTQRVYREAGEYLRAHAPPGSTLATIDSGAIPYYSGLFTIDYGGLADKHMPTVTFRPLTIDKGDGVIRRYRAMRYDPEYLLGRRPDFVHLNGGYASNGRFVIHYPEYAVVFRAMQKEGTYELDNPVFFEDGQILVKRKR